MADIFLSYLGISISVSFMIVILLLLASFLNKRYAVKWKYWIWVALAIRLIIPFGGNRLPSAPVADIQSQDIQPQRETQGASETENIPSNTQADGAARRRIMVELPTQMTAPIVYVAFIWALGSLLFILVHFVSYFYYKRQILKKGRLVKDRDILCLLFKLKRKLHIKCTVHVVKYSEAASPMLIGFFHYVLVLPEEQNPMEEGYSKEELFFILKHELIHLKRGDIYLKLLFVVANAIHWFNPLVWIMKKEATVDMELSCDERVTQGADYAAKKAYTETLLSTLHKQSAKKTVLSTGFYGGKQIMKKRFQNILAKTGKKNGAAVLICAVILTVSLGTLVGCSIMGDETEDASGPLGAEGIWTEDNQVASNQADDDQAASNQAVEPLPQPASSSTETEASTSGSPAETANPSFTDKETQDTESYDIDEEYFNLTWSPLLLNYYNTYEGQMALAADFADLAGEGMSVSVSVRGDDILEVTVRYEDSSLLTEGIEETLAKQLDAMTDRIMEQMSLYDTEIIGPASVRIISVYYTDPEGNILAKQDYAGQ